MDDVITWLGLPAAAVACLIALGWLARGAYRAAKKFDALHEVAVRELNRNHGSSMKDATDQIPRLATDLAHLKTRFEEHLTGHAPTQVVVNRDGTTVTTPSSPTVN